MLIGAVLKKLLEIRFHENQNTFLNLLIERIAVIIVNFKRICCLVNRIT